VAESTYPEALGARVARVRPLARVRAHVLRQPVAALERLVTLPAVEGPLQAVHLRHEETKVRIHVSTNDTFPLLLSRGNVS
jgi:hypothetical protein